MPRHCSAGGCKSRDNRETRNAGITFHKLPKGATRRSLWITNSHRADPWDPQTDFVYFCSKHFTPESFELTGCSGIRRLKEDAFPTVFESNSTTKCKRTGTQQKQEDTTVRKRSCSGDQENLQQETEEPTVQRSLSAAEESHGNIPMSNEEPSGVEQLPQQSSPCPSTESRPSSPSRYMRRLPPPPGFYLSKEHSYAQLSPLLWRRRYDQAIDCLEKALRQLHAAKRRENRLRSTVLRLRDKRLKHTLLASRDSWKNRGWTPEGHKGSSKGGSNQEGSETDLKGQDTGLFEDRCVEQMELGGRFLADSKIWSDEDKGYCFYCGRGQVQVGGQVECALPKTGKDVPPTDHEDSFKNSTCGAAQNTNSGPSLPHVSPAGVCLTDTQERGLQFIAAQQKLMVSDTCEGESEAVAQEHHLDLQQQFWIHGTAEGQVILVPVSAEDRPQSFVKMKDTDQVQTILVPELDLKGELEHVAENRATDEERCDTTSTSAQQREDVREKLKEHLEGFHLQLSTEFLN